MKRITCLVAFVAISAIPVLAQDAPPASPPQPDAKGRIVDAVRFLAGGALGLAMHEGGHLIFDAAFDAQPRVEAVRFGPFPFERDTRGMASGISVDERAIALVVLAPAVFDAYRYFHRDARWAKWASRIAKAGSVVLVVK